MNKNKKEIIFKIGLIIVLILSFSMGFDIVKSLNQKENMKQIIEIAILLGLIGGINLHLLFPTKENNNYIKGKTRR